MASRSRHLPRSLTGVEAGVEQFAEFSRGEDFNFAAGILHPLHAAQFIVILGQVAAADSEFEQSADEAAIVVLRAAGNLAVGEPILNLFAGDCGDRRVKAIGELAEAQAQFLGVGLADPGGSFNFEHFVEDFPDGFTRQAGRVARQVEVDAFLQGDVFGQALHGGDIIRDRKAERLAQASTREAAGWHRLKIGVHSRSSRVAPA